MASAKNALVYKGHPLRRKDNILYYGSMSDKYIIMMQIMDTKPVKPVAGAESAGELKVATRSLYAAMDVASVWLERALTKD